MKRRGVICLLLAAVGMVWTPLVLAYETATLPSDTLPSASAMPKLPTLDAPTAAKSSQPDLSALPALPSLIAPLRERHLITLYPKLIEKFEPWIPEYPWEELKLPALAMWSFRLSLTKSQQYNDLATQLTEELQKPAPTLAMHKQYLRADLLFALAVNGRARPSQAIAAYRVAIEKYPDAPHVVRAVYHVGLLLMDQQEYYACLRWCRRFIHVWREKPEWANALRSLIMEVYYLRGRYIRAEDYMWTLASDLNAEDLIPHLAIRFGDSLFWQGRFAEAAEWYRHIEPHFLDKSESSTIAGVSMLYYAESLFQIGKTEEAEAKFEFFQQHYHGEYPSHLVQYRMLQSRVEQTGIGASTLSRLKSLMRQVLAPDLQQAMTVQWARWVLAGSDPRLKQGALDRLQVLAREPMDESMHRDALFVIALLQRDVEGIEPALQTLTTIAPRTVIQVERNPLDQTIAAMVAQWILDLQPSKWAAKDFLGFLMLCDQHQIAIQASHREQETLYWVARAYVEQGMLESGARAFQRLLFEFEMDDAMRNHLVLQLAKTYADLGEMDLLGKALALVTTPPEDEFDRQLYYLMRAASAVYAEQYESCVNEIETMLASSIRGDSLFELSLQGAMCARRAKNFDSANNFVKIAALPKDAIVPDPSASTEVQTWQRAALYEKVNILVEEGKDAEAIARFEKLVSADASSAPPLETIFLLVSAYRREGMIDRAEEMWKTYADGDKAVPERFRMEYRKLLHMYRRLELVQHSTL